MSLAAQARGRRSHPTDRPIGLALMPHTAPQGQTGRRRAGPLGSAPARLLPDSLRKGWVGPLGEEPSREAWLALVPLRTDRLGIQPSVP